MSSDPKQRGFTVNDRRIVADEKGTARVEEVAPAPADAKPPEAKVEEKPEAKSAAKPQTAAAVEPPIDFHTFILSLGSSALLHLGELERPGASAPETDLPMAKHTIDILAMLQDKTRGNLTPAEEKLIESLLFDLRLRFVEARKRPG
jgi:hypothetical protein